LGVKKNSIIPKGKLEGMLEGMLDDQIFNMKMEVKLGQLIKICPQSRKILTKFLMMQKEHLLNVCNVGTHH
jgi:hypothetical protein